MCKKSNENYIIDLPIDYSEYTEKQQRYLKNRLHDQIQWYDKKAKHNQKYYKVLSVISVIISSSIPILTLFEEKPLVKILIAIAGSAVSVITYIININTFKDLWVQYRMNCEMLKSEASKFINKIPPYNSNNSDVAFDTLVSNCEQYFTKEFSTWQSKVSQSSTDS